VDWFINAVDAYTLEEPSEGKRCAHSMDVALGLTPRSGRPRDTQGNRPKIAIGIYSLREEGKSWNEIADRLQIEDARTARRIYAAHADAVVKHLISLGPSVPLGYDLKDGKLVVNKAEAATVRMIFERYVPLGSAPAPKRAFTALVRKLKAEGIIDKRGKPIDIYKVINDRVYIGEVVHKGMYSGKHKAIVDRAIWLKVHGIRRALMPARRRRSVQKDH
jgi:Recombinase